MGMGLMDIQRYQLEFDKKYFGDHWGGEMDLDLKINLIKDMTIALTGEVGEFSNLLKKINRDRKTIGEEPSSEMWNRLKEELTDCFIYIIILSNILGMDLEKEYLKKTKINHKRFQKYLKK
ncbi:MAG: MazG nucleotide pyrophosphohydrolase domain-containing protein [Candidatus Aenigmatarchaeota archaeon]